MRERADYTQRKLRVVSIARLLVKSTGERNFNKNGSAVFTLPRDLLLRGHNFSISCRFELNWLPLTLIQRKLADHSRHRLEALIPILDIRGLPKPF